MPILTIGEYRDAKSTAKGFITEQQVDFSGGVAQSAPFNAETRHIRVCGDVAHRWVIGASPTALSTSQRRPADAVEYHDVDAGKDWRISVIAE